MNHQEVETLVRAMHRLWPTVPLQAPVDAALIRLWQLVLAEIPLEGAELVLVTRSRAGDVFPPKPGEIVRWYYWLSERVTGTAAPDVDEAWAEVRRAVGARGWTQGPPEQWSHPAVAAAVKSLGWTELCRGEESIVRAHFLRLYPTVQQRIESTANVERTFGVLGPAVAAALPGVVRSLDAGPDDRRSP